MSKRAPVLIDRNPGRNAQTFGIARELGTDTGLIQEPSVGVVGNKGDSQCYIGVERKVQAIHDRLLARLGRGPGQIPMRHSSVFVRFGARASVRKAPASKLYSCLRCVWDGRLRRERMRG